jgi:hypothetical protein
MRYRELGRMSVNYCIYSYMDKFDPSMPRHTHVNQSPRRGRLPLMIDTVMLMSKMELGSCSLLDSTCRSREFISEACFSVCRSLSEVTFARKGTLVQIKSDTYEISSSLTAIRSLHHWYQPFASSSMQLRWLKGSPAIQTMSSALTTSRPDLGLQAGYRAVLNPSCAVCSPLDLDYLGDGIPPRS